MNDHDKFWIEQATMDDYADPNIATQPQVDFIVETIRPAMPRSNGSILEIGCGYGRLTREIKKEYPDSIVIGVDISPSIISQAETYSGWRNDPKRGRHVEDYPFYYCRDNIKNIPFKNAIYSVAVFQHLPNDRKREYIEDAAKALLPGGLFVFQYIEGDSNTFLTHDANFNDICDWCMDAGFEIAKVEFDFLHPRWTWIVGAKI